MDVTAVMWFVLGLALLIVGAEMLVRGASSIASAIGISPLVAGLTIVAFATSSPELAVSVQASFSGQPDVALGNVVGSNILNVLCVLGLSALIRPLVVSRQLVRLDVPLMVCASFLMLILALDGNISRLDGVLLFAGLVAHNIWTVHQSRKENSGRQKEYADDLSSARNRSWRTVAINVTLVVVGLVVLVVGSDWLVNGAVAVAKTLGVSELVIGLTIISVGTSLPELATSVVASLRGERDIAVGNVIGSNTFNILSVLGLSSIAAPRGLDVSPVALRFDIPIMIAVAVICLPIFFRGYVISRWEGALLLAYYATYVLYLVLDATQHDLLPAFATIVLSLVVPVTLLLLLVLVAWHVRGERRAATVGARPDSEEAG